MAVASNKMIKVMKGKVTKTEEGNLVYDGTVAKIVATMDLDFKYIHSGRQRKAQGCTYEVR